MSARTFDQLLADAEEQLWLGFRRARAKQHRGSRGTSREHGLASFLTGQLPVRFGVTTGEAIDADERRTGQLDVVIYDRNITAPLLAEASGDLLPAESLLAVIEVKSTLTKAEVEKCARAAKAVARLRPYGKSFIAPRQAGTAANDGRCRCQFSVVAFSSNLSTTGWCAKEWNRIKAAVAAERVSAERIDRVLVLDRGILVPPSATARSANDGKEMLREWFLHMSNFLIREADRRPAFDLQAYLDEFTFRFNRRRSRARGMLFYRLLEQSVQAPPRTYRSLVTDPGSSRRTPTPPPRDKRVRPASLAGEPLDRPWRHQPAGNADES